MKIGWGAYPSHIGHRDNGGCFRCHNDDLKAEDGSLIDSDCTICHSILAYDESEPFAYLQPVDTARVSRDMHEYLRQEFIESYLAGRAELTRAGKNAADSISAP